MAGISELQAWKEGLDAALNKERTEAVERLRDIDVLGDVYKLLAAGQMKQAEIDVDLYFEIMGSSDLRRLVERTMESFPYHVDANEGWVALGHWSPTYWRAGEDIMAAALYGSRSAKAERVGRVRGGTLFLRDLANEEWRHGVYIHPTTLQFYDVDWEGRLEEPSGYWRSRRQRVQPSRVSNNMFHPPMNVRKAHRQLIACVRDLDGDIESNLKALRKDALFVSRKLTRSRKNATTWMPIMEAVQSSWNAYCHFLGKDPAGLLPLKRAQKTAIKTVKTKLEK